jgi:hypothetical protein
MRVKGQPVGRSFEWRKLLKSARPFKFSPAVNYPKKEISGGFEALSQPLSSSHLLDLSVSLLFCVPPTLSAIDRSSRLLF